MLPEKSIHQEIADRELTAREKGCSRLVVAEGEHALQLEQCGFYPEAGGWTKDFAADDCLLKFKPNQWRADIEATLVFFLREQEVLLIRKKTGHGKGKINAPGGKLEKGESSEDCARREMLEEVGLLPQALQKVASLRFVDAEKSDWLGHIFVTHAVRGALQETPEAAPFWCPVNVIPYAQMWRDDQLWLPEVIAGKVVSGTFYFVNDALVAHRFASRPAGVTKGEITHDEDRYFSI